MLKRALQPFGESVFTEFTREAVRHQAINLAQGFPDFDGPKAIADAAIAAIRAGKNQYAPSAGLPELRQAIAAKVRRHYGMKVDPDTEVTVLSGASEAIFASISGLLEAGDEVVLIEPAYDLYAPSVAMAGGVCRRLTLHAPNFELDADELRKVVSKNTRMLVLNSPMNPCGKVFSKTELEDLRDVLVACDVLLLCDEVYEHLTFGEHRHIPAATIEGLQERTITVSSTAKTFSYTGWKVGYAVACSRLTAAVRGAHQFITFCTATPFQAAMVVAVDSDDDYYAGLVREYRKRRDVLLSHLRAAGLGVIEPDGTYFALADCQRLGWDDDFEFCRYLAAEIGVAAIPVSAFYDSRAHGRTLVRFAFCKNVDVLNAAGVRLRGLIRQ